MALLISSVIIAASTSCICKQTEFVEDLNLACVLPKMAPLPLLRVARDLLKDIKGVGEKAGDTAGDAVDTAKDSKEVS